MKAGEWSKVWEALHCIHTYLYGRKRLKGVCVCGTHTSLWCHFDTTHTCLFPSSPSQLVSTHTHILASGFRLQASGFRLLASGFWLLASGLQLLAFGLLAYSLPFPCKKICSEYPPKKENRRYKGEWLFVYITWQSLWSKLCLLVGQGACCI